jgi:hypothetical protein
MRIDFTMASGGSLEIDYSELEGMTKEEKQDFIEKAINAAAYEEVDSSLDWEISED